MMLEVSVEKILESKLVKTNNVIGGINTSSGSLAVRSLGNIQNSSIVFCNKNDSKYVELINSVSNCLVILAKDFPTRDLHVRNMLIVVDSPRLEFCKFLGELTDSRQVFYLGASNSTIHPEAQIGKNTVIAPNCYIGKASIGDNVVIAPGCSIYDDVEIGNNCIIHSNTVIGSDGFGFEIDPKTSVPVKFIQIGGVRIGNNVEVGAGCTIDRGAVDNTTICDNVKLDNVVHIAHNVVVGENTLITAHVMVAGGAKIGRNCFIAPGSSIIDNITVGDNVFVCIASCVTRDVEDSTKVMGNPAMEMKEKISIIRATRKLAEQTKKQRLG